MSNKKALTDHFLKKCHESMDKIDKMDGIELIKFGRYVYQMKKNNRDAMDLNYWSILETHTNIAKERWIEKYN